MSNEKNSEKWGQDYWQLDNLPNRLTLFRIILIPLVLFCMLATKWTNPIFFSSNKSFGIVAAIIFIAASLTDFFDGYIARKKNIVTMFGSFLDPIADKFLVVSTLIMLLSLQRIPDWVVIVLVLREMYMMSLRLFAVHEGITVHVNDLGKWKTTFQMIAIPLLLIYQKWGWFDLPLIGLVCIFMATFLSLLSSVVYSFHLVALIKDKMIAAVKLRNQQKREKMSHGP